jgi:hypothetical protein
MACSGHECQSALPGAQTGTKSRVVIALRLRGLSAFFTPTSSPRYRPDPNDIQAFVFIELF